MKKLYYIILTVSLLSFYTPMAIAQPVGVLTGTVVDEENQTVGFVNVAIVSVANNAVVTGAIADMGGKFEINSPVAGKYKLKLSGLGYQQTETAPFEVTGTSFSKDFGKFILKTDVKTLSEVTIQAMRPTITAHPDKMVVTVEGTALASGSTAYEVLAKSPGVWVDQDGNIKLNGKVGVQVLINGKQSYLSGKELQNLLQSMSAENIKDLEVITNPSAKYDAEGASGVININLKKSALSGLNGSAYAGYQYNKLNTYTTGTDLNYQKGKWSAFTSFNFSRRMRYRNMNMERVLNNEGELTTLDQESYEKSERVNPSLRLGTDYDFNSKHSIGAMVNLTHSQNNNAFITDTYLRTGNPQNDLNIDAKNASVGLYRNGTFNVHYLGKLDTTGTTLSADLDYVKLISNYESEFLNKYNPLHNTPPSVELLSNVNPTNYNIYAAKIDFTKPLGKAGKLELGAKASNVLSNNELKFYQDADGRKMLDENRSNHFIYQENIYAAYANISTNISEKWSLQAGLRAEKTTSEGELVTKNQITKRSYLDLFPSVFVQQKLNDNYQISYKYSRRINRPYYEALNPFIFFLDPYTSAQGNPYLKPQYTNSFEITQTLKQSYNLTLGYAVTKDFIAEVPTHYSENNVTIFQQQNVDDLTNLNATLVAPVKVTPKWEINNTATLSYQRFSKKIDAEALLNEQLTFTAQSNQNVQLPKGIRLEVNAGYQGPTVYGLYKINGNWWVDAGFKRSFMNDKLDVSLNVTDIFRSRELAVRTSIDGNVNAIKQYQGAQSVRLNLRYRFNKGKKFEAQKRNLNLDELNRTGN